MQVQGGLLGEDVQPAVQGEVKSSQVEGCTCRVDQLGDLLVLLPSTHTRSAQRFRGAAVALHDAADRKGRVTFKTSWQSSSSRLTSKLWMHRRACKKAPLSSSCVVCGESLGRKVIYH